MDDSSLPTALEGRRGAASAGWMSAKSAAPPRQKRHAPTQAAISSKSQVGNKAAGNSRPRAPSATSRARRMSRDDMRLPLGGELNRKAPAASNLGRPGLGSRAAVPARPAASTPNNGQPASSRHTMMVSASTSSVAPKQRTATVSNASAMPKSASASSVSGSSPSSRRFTVSVERKICEVCGKTVYAMDELKADNKIFHKSCLRCSECNKVLSLGTFAALEGKMFCKPHFIKLFKAKGDYTSGFGKEDIKSNWAPSAVITNKIDFMKPQDRSKSTSPARRAVSPVNNRPNVATPPPNTSAAKPSSTAPAEKSAKPAQPAISKQPATPTAKAEATNGQIAPAAKAQPRPNTIVRAPAGKAKPPAKAQDDNVERVRASSFRSKRMSRDDLSLPTHLEMKRGAPLTTQPKISPSIAAAPVSSKPLPWAGKTLTLPEEKKEKVPVPATQPKKERVPLPWETNTKPKLSAAPAVTVTSAPTAAAVSKSTTRSAKSPASGVPVAATPSKSASSSVKPSASTATSKTPSIVVASKSASAAPVTATPSKSATLSEKPSAGTTTTGATAGVSKSASASPVSATPSKSATVSATSTTIAKALPAKPAPKFASSAPVAGTPSKTATKMAGQPSTGSKSVTLSSANDSPKSNATKKVATNQARGSPKPPPSPRDIGARQAQSPRGKAVPGQSPPAVAGVAAVQQETRTSSPQKPGPVITKQVPGSNGPSNRAQAKPVEKPKAASSLSSAAAAPAASPKSTSVLQTPASGGGNRSLTPQGQQPAAAEKAVSTSAVDAIVSPSRRMTVKRDVCAVCEKTVYPMDKIVADQVSYHKACFRCAECNNVLKLGNYAALSGKTYCKPHFVKLFKLKGNYSVGFGEADPKAKWSSQGVVGASSNMDFSKPTSSSLTESPNANRHTVALSQSPVDSPSNSPLRTPAASSPSKSSPAVSSPLKSSPAASSSTPSASSGTSWGAARKPPQKEASSSAAASSPSSHRRTMAPAELSKGSWRQDSPTPKPQINEVRQRSASSVVLGGSKKCQVCGKSVYPMDELKADDKIFHKSCLRCAECNGVLKLGNYAALNGKYYCKPHFKKLFSMKGNYSSGFGEDDPKSRWKPQASYGTSPSKSFNRPT